MPYIVRGDGPVLQASQHQLELERMPLVTLDPVLCLLDPRGIGPRRLLALAHIDRLDLGLERVNERANGVDGGGDPVGGLALGHFGRVELLLGL